MSRGGQNFISDRPINKQALSGGRTTSSVFRSAIGPLTNNRGVGAEPLHRCFVKQSAHQQTLVEWGQNHFIGILFSSRPINNQSRGGRMTSHRCSAQRSANQQTIFAWGAEILNPCFTPQSAHKTHSHGQKQFICKWIRSDLHCSRHPCLCAWGRLT